MLIHEHDLAELADRVFVRLDIAMDHLRMREGDRLDGLDQGHKQLADRARTRRVLVGLINVLARRAPSMTAISMRWPRGVRPAS